MAKRFRTKKKMRIDFLIKYIIIILITYITIKLCIYVLMDTKITSFIYSKYKIKDYINYLSQNTINEPVSLLNYKLTTTELPTIQKEVIAPIAKPSIYIYNSHQREGYIADNTDTLGMEANVYFASHYFKQELEKYNINVLVEEGNINDFLVTNNMDYSYSYVASRYFLEDTLKNNNFNLIIDLHRDATKKSISTTTINETSYAKIMFVVGKEYQTYQTNLALANQINDLISTKYPDLSRGVIQKSGPGVNGIYNQDLGGNIILLELGCQENTIEEVTNTINLLAPIIGEYLNGQAI